MNSLDEAWRWYRETRTQLSLFGRLGRSYWGELPWGGGLGRDSKFVDLEGKQVAVSSEFCLEHLDDLAVLVLFSVFEGTVRERVLTGIKLERANIKDRHLLSILDSALDGIENGSFYNNVLRVFKVQDANLVEEVNQVRQYRNWVAHGRRSRLRADVSPKAAYERLKRFLALLDAGDTEAV
jgi:hypothetical protein